VPDRNGRIEQTHRRQRLCGDARPEDEADIEPDDNGDIHELHLVFNDQEYQYVKQLAEKVWEHVQKVSLPEVGEFSSDLKGTEAFEQALLDDIL